MADAALALPPAPQPARPRVLLVGTALVAAGAFMAIVGLVGVYISARTNALATGGTWLPAGSSIPLTPGNMAFATMLLSGVSMWWAVDAVGKNDRQMAYLALALTIFFGIAVINATSFLYSQMDLAVSSTPGVLIFAVTGAHLAMIILGLVYAAVMTFRTLGGEYHGRDREGLTAAALFWYVTIAAHAVIWLAIYVTK
ncbi:cytochrome c oxidase subunit 3 [Aquihabitans sp. G128]|uniref:cytochrome c oxidase subunit 3 n=1 Tax=Aquihabitans sp. G128 TaxID=2849779 RepID=UPI001C21BB4F|nr:cytochrome c oxidase subunit 3 [Aquihabitans sp. G128]QXC59489.1 cytochrome c oxidase subunit 3 [Aquihabitans sp. G128]